MPSAPRLLDRVGGGHEQDRELAPSAERLARRLVVDAFHPCRDDLGRHADDNFAAPVLDRCPHPLLERRPPGLRAGLHRFEVGVHRLEAPRRAQRVDTFLERRGSPRIGHVLKVRVAGVEQDERREPLAGAGGEVAADRRAPREPDEHRPL
jgi:hypothetical protein